MNLADLHLAVVIAEEGGLSGASVRLGISPGTLSKAVTRLERATKVKLFERLPRGMRPTEFGQAFLERARRIDLDAADLHAQLRDLRQARAGVLRFGIGQGLPERWVRAVTVPLAERGVRLDLTGGMTDSLSRAVAAGELEFALIGLSREPDEALAWESLRDDPMVPACAADHPFAQGRRQIDWSQLAGSRWIMMARGTATRAEFDANFLERGLQPPEPVVTSRTSLREVTLMHALGALVLVPRSLLSDRMAAGQVAIEPEGGWRSQRRLGVITRRNGYVGPAALQAIDALRQALAVSD